MTFDELQKAVNEFKPVFLLEDIVTHQKRVFIRQALSWICFVTLIIMFLIHFSLFSSLAFLVPYIFKIRGLFLISFGLAIGLSMLEAFFYSYFGKVKEKSIVSYSLANLIFSPSSNDPTYSLLTTSWGWDCMDRLEITREEVKNFLGGLQTVLKNSDVIFEKTSTGEQYDLPAYVAGLFRADKELQDFLFAHNVQKEDLIGAMAWVEDKEDEAILKERWWQREALGRIPGLAKNWAYGQTYVLDRYGYDLTEEMSLQKLSGRMLFVRAEVTKLEGVLSRSREANAIVIGDDEDERLAVVEALAKRIHDGTVLPILEHKRVFLINANALVEHNPDKASFETEFTSLFSQAIETGNAIVVIAQFPALLLSARTFGTDIGSLLDPFLKVASLQIVALSDAASFHQYVESNTDLFQHFESIQITAKDSTHLMNLLQGEVEVLEAQTGAFFTYQGLQTIIESVERYFGGLPPADKARDLLFELIPHVIQKGGRVIGKKEVLSLIESKTGIPTGEVKEEEKEKLLNLEKILHEKIIGQDEAVKAISQALRRSRSDLRSHEKPIGSFLFLGPTGVGKTETSKALAEVFFGVSAPVVRLDMSEYAGPDALQKLVGSFKDGKAGVLSSALREHQYGILLLDEFEKADKEVHNLFLQILDEGFFSDMQGRKVNVRNMIIIATSNAGSDLIFDMVKAGKDLKASKDELLQAIITRNIFKPELLNRFDGTIIFHPLETSHLEKVATLILEKSIERLKKQGYELIITPELIQYLISHGSDSKFGARPMNRAVSEEVESVISEEMIKGTLPKGSRFQLVPEALPNGKLLVKISS